MISALLAGRKTQTRRILKPQPYPFVTDGRPYWNARGCIGGRISISDAELLRLHRWVVGDRLYVREAWAPLDALTHNDPGTRAFAEKGFYRADQGTVDGEISRWRPSIHMPRWASRLTLLVADIRVQRLQDISQADSEAEGIYERGSVGDGSSHDRWTWQREGWRYATPREAFRELWGLINGPDAWAANPWVAAVSFSVIRSNIDATPLPSPAQGGK
ncbi:hypothetical protein GGR33_001569 [Methylobacterium brachythecii]|nr:hypothetical protein [Methylobacterium brachythecii]MBB3902074.1 hypothetical protein [Methylobacterium brachythecii]